MAKFDYEAAKKAGVSDEKIAGFLSEKYNFDLEKAKNSGASLDKINQFLSDREEDGKSIGQRAKEYFTKDKFGEAMVQQMKSGGFAGVPTATPEQAKDIAIQTVLSELLGPLAGKLGALAGKSPILPGVASAGTRMGVQAQTVPIHEQINKAIEEGDWLTAEELKDAELSGLAISATGEAINLGIKGGKGAYDFAKAVKNIAKEQNRPTSDVIKDLWKATQNYLKQKFGRNIQNPSDITPEDGKELIKKTQELEQRILGAPPKQIQEPVPEVSKKEPPKGSENQQMLTPEDQKITAPEKYFKSDYEIAEDIENRLLLRVKYPVGKLP